MKPVTIYALAHPKSPDVIRYIGKTCRPLRRRLSGHVSAGNVPNCRTKWIQSILEDGKRPVIWPIEICSGDNWPEREKHWISFFRPLGFLLNTHDGGHGAPNGGGWTRTIESRRKQSISQLGRKVYVSEARRKYLVESAKRNLKWPAGKPRPRRTLESRQRMSQKMMGRKISWDTNVAASHAIIMPIFKACNEKRKKAVFAVETGQEFASINDAIRGLGCTESGFREALKRGWKCRGVHWKFKESEKII